MAEPSFCRFNVRNRMKIWMAFLLLASTTVWGQTKTLFFMSNGAASVRSFMEHKDKIDIISPTWYQVDQSGLVSGEPQPDVLRAAKQAHVSIVPIFALFDKDKVHKLLLDDTAQDEMNKAFVRECKENGYDGIQFDFEDILWTDRDVLSAAVKKTAAVLHREHLQVEIDVVPNAPGHAGETAFGKVDLRGVEGGVRPEGAGRIGR